MQKQVAKITKQDFLYLLDKVLIIDAISLRVNDNEVIYLINIEDANELLDFGTFDIMDFDETLYSSLPKPRKKS